MVMPFQLRPSKITLVGVDGSLWHLSGTDQGAEGVELAIAPSGAFDAPVSTIWNATAFQTGATWYGMRYDKRDLVLSFNVSAAGGLSWETVDGKFRNAWSYTTDATLIVTTETSTRCLHLRLSQHPDFSPKHDPHLKSWAPIVLTCTAGFPFWIEQDITQTWASSIDTTSGAHEQEGSIEGENPTDLPMYLEWVCSAPAQWTLPDFSFGLDYNYGSGSGAANIARVVTLPQTVAGQDLTINTNPELPMIISADGSNLWAAMNGVSFLYPVPPKTPPTTFPVWVTYAPAGASVMLVQNRFWTRPWGLQP
ncbi:hypothetical protein ACIP5Y_21485 [Nocardia sp. NPDC088792]|uniref:hypothetical protein n=1 Tax=Nocardia sp. NPDC088792 TaxID=3364332 RepID=UPI0038201BD4